VSASTRAHARRNAIQLSIKNWGGQETALRSNDNLVSQGVSNTGQMNHFYSCSNKKIMSSKVIQKWVELYLRAALEVDGQETPWRIVTAREAVAARLKDLEGNRNHHAERHEMQSALAALICIEDETNIRPTVAIRRSQKTVLSS
jgi:hypothetical protein